MSIFRTFISVKIYDDDVGNNVIKDFSNFNRINIKRLVGLRLNGNLVEFR